MKNADTTEAIAALAKLLKPGATVYTVLRHRSSSGMSRSIDVLLIKAGEPREITYHVARALGRKIDNKNGGIRMGGCGMDMGFEIVYQLGLALWPNGTKKPHGMRNGEPDTNGGYALKHRWL